MRPISVEFQAFGPYKGHEVIDFEKLSKSGLFLIEGETGSGKTMIIDAITLALFGECSGENRGGLEELRCNRCSVEEKTETFVKFKFEEKGKIYLFERKLTPKRVKIIASQNAYVVKDDGTLDPIFENCTKTVMNAKAKELIGLDYDQFRQVMVLPQGKFEKLLVSDSADKEEILKNIFGAEKWQIIADKYYTRAENRKKDLENKVKDRDRILSEEGCKTLEELKEKAESLKEAVKARAEEYSKADYSGKKETLMKAQALANEFKTLHEYEEKVDALNAEEGDIKVKEEELTLAEKAESLRKPIEKLSGAEGEFKDRQDALKKAEESYTDAETGKNEAKEALDKHAEMGKDYEAWKKSKSALEAKKPFYESCDELSKAEESAFNLLNKAKEAEAKLKEENEEAVRKTAEAFRSHQDAVTNTNNLRTSYMSGIAGILAKDLLEGNACPVCGSLNHPKKAEIVSGTATKDDIEAAEREEEKKKTLWENADKSRASVEEKYTKKKDEAADLKVAYEKAKTEHEGAEKNLENGIDTLEELESKITKLSGMITDYENSSKTLSDALSEARDKFSAAAEGKKKAEEEKVKAKGNLTKADEELKKALKLSGFETRELAEDSMLDEEERKELHNKISSHKANLEQMNGLLENKKKALAGKDEPDLEAVRTALNDIADAEKKFTEDQTRDKEESARLSKKYKELFNETKDYEEKIKSAEDDFNFARALRGTTGIGIQRYVLGIMFSSVISAANEMLSKVHEGRYKLFRTNESTGDAKKRGLDLKVYDRNGGGAEGRSVGTLSGGEKFLASLALSIGMSNIAKTGGVDIEGLFIDEGFGTLSANSVGDALAILSGVNKSSGMVGIISHVDLLKENIPVQLHIEKGHDTSTVKMA